MSPGRVRVLLGVGAVLAGALAVTVSALAERPPAATVDAAPAAVNAGAHDPMDISANNSPTLARNPRDADNVVLAHRVDEPRFGCGFHVSFDAGATWVETTIPRPPGTEPKCYAPDLAFGADGTLHLSYVMLAGAGNVPDSVWVASSSDGGRTLTDPNQVTGPLAFQVRLAADPVVADRLVLTWLQAETTGYLSLPDTGNPVLLAASDDGGETWQEPVQVSHTSRERVLAPTPAVGDGVLYVLHLDVLDDRLDYHGAHAGVGGPAYPGPWELVLARSDDAGRTWSETTVTADLVPIERFIVFLPKFPSLAVDGDRVHAAFHDGRLGDADVWVWTSPDGGRRWHPPVRVNDTREGDATSQYLPQVALAPAGRLDVVYYDRRADPDDIMNEVSLQSSVDGGETFGPRTVLSDRSFDSRVGWGSERDLPELGSRLALLSADTQALAAWTDTRAGDLDWGEQHIFRASVAFVSRAPSSALRALRWTGYLLVVAGLVVIVRTLLVGARPEHPPRSAPRPRRRSQPPVRSAGPPGRRP